MVWKWFWVCGVGRTQPGEKIVGFCCSEVWKEDAFLLRSKKEESNMTVWVPETRYATTRSASRGFPVPRISNL